MKATITDSSISSSPLKRIGIFLGPVIFLAVLLFTDFDPANPLVSRMAAIALLMAIWWITEAIPLYVTALLPMLLYPLLGILKAGKTAPIYFNSTIFLFLGGFMIALAMEKWKLHKRIALFIIRAIGGGPSRIVLGFMLVSAFLSMWISNTATVIMMLPIALAIILQMEEKYQKSDTKNFSTALLLGIAYASSVGGIATLVGTPPNLSFARIFQIMFPSAEPIAFGSWFLMGLPITIVMLFISWIFLIEVFFKPAKALKINHSVIQNEYSGLGKTSYEEKIVSIVFVLAALLWVFRKTLNIGFISIPGWSQLLPYPALIDDGTIALGLSILLFILPARDKTSSPTILPPDTVLRLPWNIILLFGGGFALAKGFQSTGLAEYIGNQFIGYADVSPLAISVMLCSFMTFATELTSNTATTEMILPILASIATALKINPLLLMIPATLSASCAFMMPVATPPNAIIFGSQRVRIFDMVKVGLLLNVVGIIVIATMFYWLGTIIFTIDNSVFPDWATGLQIH
jgi:solute carrier family 13 (sodium-dependent dicarboxylate transporter), member 2/3/5